jgi:hypothetical protein
MAINFPDSPSLNDYFTSGGTTWVWDGSKWNLFLGQDIVTGSQLSSTLSSYAVKDSPTFSGTATFVNKPIIPGYQNEIPYQSSAPSSPETGDYYVDSDENILYIYISQVVGWKPIGANLSAYSGNINPSITNSYDLGTSSLRWRNIYTQDLHLSNGIGDYTIVEGEENLYLTNNKNGKSYKFALIEVDSSEVPPKSEGA